MRIADSIFFSLEMPYFSIRRRIYFTGICLHLHVISGRDPHHIAEAEFKALARALRFAIEPDPRVDGIPSTKGAL